MDFGSKKLCFAAFLIAALAAINGVAGDTMVTGTVFCDQCKDGQVSFLDYPLPEMNVSIACPGNDGKLTSLKEDSTNFIGGFAVRIAGTPDLRGCFAQISGGRSGSSSCVAGAGPPHSLRLIFNMFDMAMYTVDPLLSQPEFPMSFCPKSASPGPAPLSPGKAPPTAEVPSPAPPRSAQAPVPYLEASACSHQKWIMPEYKCHWRVVSPDAKVGVVFGLAAAERYGMDMTLWNGMQGRGEPYKTLLREGITALLNSYSSIHFPYQPLGVVASFNYALAGNQRQVLRAALRFMRANAGSNGRLSCKFSRCNA